MFDLTETADTFHARIFPSKERPALLNDGHRDRPVSHLSGDDLRDRPCYPAAEAARLVGLNPARVRRWLKGYDYLHGGNVRHQHPVVRRESAGSTSYASFLDLVDLLFVKRFLDSGVSLQKIRVALREAFEILGTTHVLGETFFTDGSDIFVRVKDKGNAILELLADGQWTIAPIIEQLAEQIDFAGGLACRWYPLGREEHVVLDPFVCFGRPMIPTRGIATASVYDLFRAENERIESVRAWWDLTSREVKDAVRFERLLAA